MNIRNIVKCILINALFFSIKDTEFLPLTRFFYCKITVTRKRNETCRFFLENFVIKIKKTYENIP